MDKVIVVLDIGKTHVKLSVVDNATGALLETLKKNNQVVQTGPYPHADIEGIWQWYCAALKALASRFYIAYLSCTTHGATAVCLADGELAFPVMDYESDHYTNSVDSKNSADSANSYQAYEHLRPAYEETFSPLLGNGLNIGRQLFWLSRHFAAAFAKVDTLLMYPQYWGWRLSGVAVSEVTSLGCHTDLWQPQAGQYSSFVEQMGWTPLFPPLLAAGEVLGAVLPQWVACLGLPEDCQVVNGIHDSNASLVPYLRSQSSPFTVISSGTWVIMAGVGSALTGMAEQDDMLANVNAYGEPVPCIRFMGGREWELLRGDVSSEADVVDLQAVLQRLVFALPSFSAQGGPFRHQQGLVIGPVSQLKGAEKAALASLYCALVTHCCLDKIQSQGAIYLEGSFADNTVYCAVLSQLRADQPLYLSEDSTGTTQGVVHLIQEKLGNAPPISRGAVVTSAPIKGLSVYAEQWLAQVTAL